MPRLQEPLVSVVFDRPHKLWNAREMAGFPPREAAFLVENKIAHYPEDGPLVPVMLPSEMGSGSSGMSICARCGAHFVTGSEHECPKGATAAGPEVFEAGFESKAGRRGRRGRGR